MNKSASPSSPARKPARRPIPWLQALAIAAVFAVGVGVLAFIFRSAIRTQVWAARSRTQVEQARKLSQAGQHKEAVEAALTAHRLDPKSIEALRVLFGAATQTDSPYAANSGAALFLHPECGSQEKLNLLSYFDLSRNDRHFIALFGQLDEIQRRHPDAQFLMIRFLLSRGSREEAAKRLDAYLKEGGKDRRFEGLRARWLLTGTPAEREQGQAMVATLMREADEVSRQAFGLLWDVPPVLLRPDLYPGDLAEWVDRLPGAGAREKLIVAQLELAKAPQDKNRQDEVFAKAVADFREPAPEILCDWLTRFQRFDLILEVADEKRARKSLPLYDHRLRALASVQGIAAAEAWLAEPLPNASLLQIWLSRAKLAHIRKDRHMEQKCWKEALAVAALDETYRHYLPIFRTAVAMREMDIACRALLEAALHPGSSFPVSLEIQPVIEYLYAKDRLKDLSLISQRVLQDEPGNVVLLNNVIYISLILGKPQEHSVKTARELVEKYPKILGLRTTLALALRAEKKSQEARSFLEAPEADWKTASPADLTIRSLVLEDCGEKAQAEVVRQQVNHKLLSGSERRAFAAVFKDRPAVADPDQLFADIRTWMLQGGQKFARQLLEEYFANGGDERRFSVLYAQILLELQYAENDPHRGQELIAELLGEPDDHARKALALLANYPAELIHPQVFSANLQEWVRKLPNPAVPEILAAAKVETLRAGERKRDRILLELIDSTGKSNPEPVAALLIALGRHELVLRLLDEALAKSSGKLRDYRMQALVKVQGPEAGRKWLEICQPGAGNATTESWLSTARLRHSLGDATGTLNAFREASSLAGRDQTTNQFLTIYKTAMELGQTPVAIRALLSACLHPGRGVPSVAELTPILTKLYAEDRMNDLHTLTRTLLNQDPANDTLRNLQAYLSLLLKDPTTRALDVSADLVKRHPNIIGFRTTQALALTLEQQYDAALQALPQEADAWNHASPVDLAILALAQENTGQITAAAETRTRFEPDDLLPTERRAFAAARRKLPVPGVPAAR